MKTFSHQIPDFLIDVLESGVIGERTRGIHALNFQISGEYTITREICGQGFTHVIVAVERSSANPLPECYLDNNYLAVPFTCDYSGK